MSIRRILNVPKRGIGDRAEGAIEAYAQRERIPFASALERVRDINDLASRSAASIESFVTMMQDLRTVEQAGAAPALVLQAAMEASGYLAELQASADPQDESRVENLAELEAVAAEFTIARPEGTLVDFLEQVSLVADADDIPDADDSGGVVTLMTLHTAKGLEFPVVFLTGMEDGVFPHMRSLGDPRELDEERRLAYVGITRARQRLYVTRSAMRSAWGSPSFNPPSRFLDEIGDAAIDWAPGSAEVGRSGSWGGTVTLRLRRRRGIGLGFLGPSRRTPGGRGGAVAAARGSRDPREVRPGHCRGHRRRQRPHVRDHRLRQCRHQAPAAALRASGEALVESIPTSVSGWPPRRPRRARRSGRTRSG